MEKDQNNKLVDKESNAHCVANLEAKRNTRSFTSSITQWSTYITPSGISRKKPSHIPSSGPSDHPGGSPSVAMSVNTSTLPNIKPTTLTSDVTSEKKMLLFM